MPGEVEFRGTPFQEAIDFFQGKVRVPTRTYTDLMNKAHSKAFMVAGAMRDDLLCDLQEAIGRAFTAGDTLEDFRNDFDNIVAKYGWKYKGGRNWRTRVIYDTNVRTAYSAGHWQQMQETKKLRPYGRYVHGQSINPREQHLAWNGKVVPLDDPWWNYRWPPNGWGCKCSVTSVSKRELERNGWTVSHPEPDETIKVTLNTPDGPIEVETVEGVDPSFAYNPGKSAYGFSFPVQPVRELNLAKGWRMVPWGSRTMETWESLGRPENIPVDKSGTKLAEQAHTEEEMIAAFGKMLEGREFLPTADGDLVRISVEMAKHVKPDRAPFVPLLPEILADPYEVWLCFEEGEKGFVTLRKTYIKVIQTEGGERAYFVVVEARKGQMSGWTFVPVSRTHRINNLRKGKLVWERD